MDVISVVIVDDEPFARKKIVNFLQDRADFRVVGECENGQEALRVIPSKNPDVVFLDIQMPELDGLSVLQKLPAESLPVIIFVTAYDQFAIKAFEMHALDYLLKPFDHERFERTLERINSQFALKKQQDETAKLQQLIGQLNTRPQFLARIMLKAGSDIYFLKTDRIVWIEAAGNYLTLHEGKKKHLLRDTMANIEKLLDPDKFVRIHRSQIVNIERIKKLQSDLHGEYIIHLDTGQALTLTRTYREKLLGKYSGRN